MFLHLSRVNAPSPLSTDPYSMNMRGCALIASTLAKCECEEQRFMTLFIDCHGNDGDALLLRCKEPVVDAFVRTEN